jgi:hypothetical protein
MVSMPFILSNELGGPIWAAVASVYVAVIALAIYVCVDSLLPKRQARLSAIPEPRAFYLGVSALYLVCVAGVWVPSIPQDWSLIPVFFTPLELAVGAAYLLRVDFPAPVSALQAPAEPPTD